MEREERRDKTDHNVMAGPRCNLARGVVAVGRAVDCRVGFKLFLYTRPTASRGKGLRALQVQRERSETAAECLTDLGQPLEESTARVIFLAFRGRHRVIC